MYRSLQIDSFRCFKRLKIDGFHRMNLIAGVNNVGKTALLEALFLHSGAYNPQLTLSLSHFRGIRQHRAELGSSIGLPWESFFADFDLSKAITIEGEDDQYGSRTVRLRTLREADELAAVGQVTNRERPANSEETTTPGASPSSSESPHVLELIHEHGSRVRKYHMILDSEGLRASPISPTPPYPCHFLSAMERVASSDIARRYSKLETDRREGLVLQALRIIEPSLTRLTVALPYGEPTVQGDIGLDRLVPLPVMGDGMGRLLNLVVTIGNSEGGVVLVDEIENGLHHSVLEQVWQVIAAAAGQFNTQVIATTHSRECIVAAHRAFHESGAYDFRLHRLERSKGEILAVTYDEETLEAAIETGLEVR